MKSSEYTIAWEDNNYTLEDINYKYYRPVVTTSLKYAWSQEAKTKAIEARWQREQVRLEKEALAHQKKLDFLTFAGAIGLHPLHYADWLVDYLRAGGTACRTPETFPYEQHDTDYHQDSYWLLTNTDVMASDIPAGFGANKLHVFVTGNERFIRQFGQAIQEQHGAKLPSETSSHPTGQYFKSGADKAYGQSTIHYSHDIEVPSQRWLHKPQTARVGYASRPQDVKLHADVVPLAYEVAADSPFVIEQLDRIVTNGTNRILQ